MFLQSPRRLSAPAKLVAGAAAAGVTLLVGAGLIGAFHAASPPLWLPASPELLAELARCDAERGPAARDQCRQLTALRRMPPADAPIRLAADDPSPAHALRHHAGAAR